MRIAICIITFQRPEMLRTALESLTGLLIPDDVSVEVIVIDNDSAGAAVDVVEDLTGRSGNQRGEYPFPIFIEHEPQRGIPFARNRAVCEARAAGADVVAFIDDDETADADWLAELVRVQRKYNADVVAGPVCRVFPDDAPAWTRKSTVYNRPRYATGTPRPYADTGNVLTRMAVFDGVDDGPFDTSIGRGGGSDRRFYSAAAANGASIVWADDAIVYEPIPLERLTLRWVLRRAMHGGNQLVHNRAMGVPRLIGRAVVGFTKSIIFLPMAIVQGRAGLVRALWHGANAIGIVAGLSGRRMEQYGEV